MREFGFVIPREAEAHVAGICLLRDEAKGAMDQLGVEFGDLFLDSTLISGIVWKSYRVKDGKRNHMCLLACWARVHS
ncbi:MAG: hypothetical protein CMH81_05140 [Nitrospiraceae bacterium]|jgi:hypothetical protein|nr:hypothetical protein [Nitrospiraceae bacterium]